MVNCEYVNTKKGDIQKMMKILQINSFNNGSTGKIMLAISDKTKNNGMLPFIAYPKSKTNDKKHLDDAIIIGNILSRSMHRILGFLTGFNDFFSIITTLNFIKKIKKKNPDVIHLHNLHSCYLNIIILFIFLKKYKKPVVWTLHDCWAFTGGCTHYSGSSNYKNEIFYYNSNYNDYPKTLFNNQKLMFLLKRKIFSNIDNMTLVVPSYWLKSKVNNTFLRNYPVKVINNGINLNIYKPTKSNFREKYNLTKKIIILGVSNSWSDKKGLDIFIKLSQCLESNYQIVLVGISKSQNKDIPKNILCISNTANEIELVKIYSAADVLINPSKLETMGMITVEALACGVPVIVSNKTAVPEMVDSSCGIIINGKGHLPYLEEIKSGFWRNITKKQCITWANRFDSSVKYAEYINLYKSL